MQLIPRSMALILILCSTTFALASNHWRTDVPFNFTIKGKSFPLGRYDISIDATHSFVTLMNYDNPEKRVTWVALPNDPMDKSAVMIFHKFGSGYSLKTIRVEETSTPDLDPHSKHDLNISVLAIDAR